MVTEKAFPSRTREGSRGATLLRGQRRDRAGSRHHAEVPTFHRRRPPQLRANGRFPRGPTPMIGGHAASSQVTSAPCPAKGASTHWLPSLVGRSARTHPDPGLFPSLSV